MKEESVARQEAEEKIGSLQHRSSLLELDLENKKSEMSLLQETVKELQEKLEGEGKRRMEVESRAKKVEEEYISKLSQREQEMKTQINELKTGLRNHEDNIYRLKR